MKRRNIVILAILVVFQFCCSLCAAPTTADEAQKVVTGWLKGNSHPLGTDIGRQVMKVETFTNNDNEPVYYIVYLEPAGFVIVSADNLVEPIIGFSDEGTYNPSQENPLGALVTNDLNRRVEAARGSVGLFSTSTGSVVTKNQKKWNSLKSRAAESGDGLRLMAVDSISDIRVAPLIDSVWGQTQTCVRDCYNYYTPRNYPCGCVATAMAQLMRYFNYPVEPNDYDPNEPDGRSRFWITVIVGDEEQMEQRLLRGGDGNGGPYQWDQVVPRPGCSTTLEQREAIGAICYDAGIATGMTYTEYGSGTYSWLIPEALLEVFNFSNAIHSMSEDSNEVLEIEREPLVGMVNTNLDAGNPVILGISDSEDLGRHAVLCDGYGYDSGVLYHHLNLGWAFMPYECRQVWYELPDVSDECRWREGNYIYILEYNYDSVIECVYNIFTVETGEIISGRVFDAQGIPVKGVEVTAQKKSGVAVYTSITDDKGIYALKGLESEATYILTADKTGYNFNAIEESTGKSENGSPVSGNKWGVNFGDYSSTEIITCGTETSNWDYPIHTEQQSSRTQVIYLTSEIGRSGVITVLALDVVTIPLQGLENWTIRMKHTGMSEYEMDACSLEADDWVVVYRNNELIDANGWYEFEFQTPFEYNGIDNLLVDFSYRNSFQTENAQCRVSNPGGMRSIYASSDNQYGDPLDWSATESPVMHCSNNMPNVKLTISKKIEVISEYTKLTATDGAANDNFGFSVSINGNYAIVGAPGPEDDENSSGAAYIFRNEGSGWIQDTKLVLSAHDREGDDYFGCSVAINEDYAIVGAYRKNDLHGSAYVFERDGTSWTQRAELGPDGFACGFGDSVSISGDCAIIGERGYAERDNGYHRLSSNGTAYVFKRDDTGWTRQAVLKGSGLTSHARFGDAVSICGNYAVAAAEFNYDPSRQIYGAVYIFERDGINWTQRAKLSGTSSLIADAFGRSVSISEDYVVIGWPGDDDNGIDSGSIYIHERQGTNWEQQTRLKAADGGGGDDFGCSVSISGDFVVIGADRIDEGVRDTGCAYVYKRDVTGWRQYTKLTALDAAYDDYFGNSVSIEGNYVIVGAKGDDNDNGFDSGSAYIFKLE